MDKPPAPEARMQNASGAAGRDLTGSQRLRAHAHNHQKIKDQPPEGRIASAPACL